MEGRFNNSPLLMAEQEDSENSSPANSEDSPRSALLNHCKLGSTSSPKRGRRSIQKRVVSVPIKDVDGCRVKGEITANAPPCDSWAWRKYGQKPIKGSPYPRGYYRCSSSKGCPARKQVERSRDDPNTLLVTYSCEHNHSGPAARNHHPARSLIINNHSTTTSTSAATAANYVPTTSSDKSQDEDEEEEDKPTAATNNVSFTTQQEHSDNSHEKLFNDNNNNIGRDQAVVVPPLIIGGVSEFGWLSDFECTSSTMLESPILMTEDKRVTSSSTDDADMNMFRCSMGEEDELLFADLGELPECSTVFRRGMMFERDEERRRHSLTTWCGPTS